MKLATLKEIRRHILGIDAALRREIEEQEGQENDLTVDDEKVIRIKVTNRS